MRKIISLIIVCMMGIMLIGCSNGGIGTTESEKFIKDYDLSESVEFTDVGYEFYFGEDSKLEVRSDSDSGDIKQIQLVINEFDIDSIWQYREAQIFDEFIEKKTGNRYLQDFKSRVEDSFFEDESQFTFIDDEKIEAKFYKYKVHNVDYDYVIDQTILQVRFK